MRKKVFITGISKGIGRSIAERFLQEGYIIYGTYFHSEKKAYDLITQYGDDCVKLFGPYDFCKLDEVQNLLNELQAYTFDCVVFNVGIFSGNDDFRNFDLKQFQEVMNCNFYASLILGIGLQNNITEGGSIVIISSIDAYSGAYLSISYSVSKSALLSLMKCLSVNYGLKNVRVNSVSPSVIDTDMSTPDVIKIVSNFAPISRIGKPIDVAKVVYFLASDEASYISGENITIDGGYRIVDNILKCEVEGIDFLK